MKKIFPLICALLLFSYCRKNEAGGNAEITGQVVHHTRPIAQAAIYVKYDASEFPGTDVTKYDYQLQAGSDGRYTFDCFKGSYYLYAIGIDHAIGKQVAGGVPVKVRSKEEVKADIAVTEQH